MLVLTWASPCLGGGGHHKPYRQRIPESSCASKETVDINILVPSQNVDRKIIQSIRIMSRPPSRKRKWDQLSQFWRISAKVIPTKARTPFLKQGKVNFDYLPRRRESEKLKKGGGSTMQGQVFLKGGEGLTLLFNFFKVYHFYI